MRLYPNVRTLRVTFFEPFVLDLIDLFRNKSDDIANEGIKDAMQVRPMGVGQLQE